MRLRYRDERFAFVRFRLDGLIAKCGEFCLSFLSQWFCGILSQWYLFALECRLGQVLCRSPRSAPQAGHEQRRVLGFGMTSARMQILRMPLIYP